VSVTIIALFMALIGGQILSSVKAAGLIERRQTAMLLAESITGRLQAGGFELTDQAQQLSDTFGITYPGWGWRVSTETTDDPSLMRVHLQVLQGDPTQSDAPVESMAVVTETYTFWAIPAKMDPVADLGLSDADVTALADKGFDVTNPAASLANVNIAELLGQYPQLGDLLKSYGIDPSLVAAMDPDTVRKAVESYLAANGGTLPNLPGMGGAAGAGGGNTGAGGANAAGGGAGTGGSNNNGNNGSGGPLDWGEVAKLMNSGDRAALEAYVQAHSGGGAGSSAGGRRSAGGSGATSGNRGGTGGNRSGSGGTSGNRGATGGANSGRGG
jgi:hypothetical protein